MQPPQLKQRQALLLLFSIMLVACYLALVWPALSGPFIFDDMPNLDALARSGHIDSWASVASYLSEARFFPGRPLAMLSFVPQQADWPNNPYPMKLVNLLLHLANAGVLYVLALTVVKRARPDWPRQAACWIAVFAAAAWLVHPMQLSTVMLVIQRMTLLSTLFTVIGLLCYLRGLGNENAGTTARGLWMTGGVVIGGLLAVLCKETGALLPVFAWAIDATLLRAEVVKLPAALRRLRWLLLYPAMFLVLAFLVWSARDFFAPIVGRDFTIAERLLTEPRVLADYAAKLLVPRYATFGVYHDDFPVSHGIFSPWSTLPCLLGLAGIITLAFCKRQRFPLFAFAVFWFVGGHALESGPVALEVYFEHRNYLPMFGPILAIVIGIASLPMGSARRLIVPLASIWLLGCLFATALYANVWSSAEKLTYFWAASHPGSVRAQGDYAAYLFEKGLLDGSDEILMRLKVSNPTDIGVDMNLTYVSCVRNTLTRKDVAELRSRLSTAPWSRLGYEGLGQIRELASAGRCGDALDANGWLGLSDALLSNPAFGAERNAAGRLHYQRHELFRARGALDQTIHELDETAKYENDPGIARLKAKYLADAGLFDQAIAALTTYNGDDRPILRRWLVDDAQINRDMIEKIREQEKTRVAPKH